MGADATLDVGEQNFAIDVIVNLVIKTVAEAHGKLVGRRLFVRLHQPRHNLRLLVADQQVVLRINTFIPDNLRTYSEGT